MPVFARESFLDANIDTLILHFISPKRIVTHFLTAVDLQTRSVLPDHVVNITGRVRASNSGDYENAYSSVN